MNHYEHKNFVPPTKPIEIWNVRISPKQRDAVKAHLAAQWPSVDACQVVTSNGRFRLLAVRGAVIPDACTPRAVLDAILHVQAQVDATMAVLQPDKVSA